MNKWTLWVFGILGIILLGVGAWFLGDYLGRANTSAEDKLYTYEQVQEACNEALEEYKVQIEEYKEQIKTLTASVQELNTQLEGLTADNEEKQALINTLNSTITELNSLNSQLQSLVLEYEAILDELRDENKVVVTFEFNGEPYSVKYIEKNSYVTVDNPVSTDTVIFNGWTLNGQDIVDISTILITEDTKFIANLTIKYEISFEIDGEISSTQIVTSMSEAEIPTAPEKDGYTFMGYSIDGEIVISNIESYVLQKDETFVALYRLNSINLSTMCDMSLVGLWSRTHISFLAEDGVKYWLEAWVYFDNGNIDYSRSSYHLLVENDTALGSENITFSEFNSAFSNLFKGPSLKVSFKENIDYFSVINELTEAYRTTLSTDVEVIDISSLFDVVCFGQSVDMQILANAYLMNDYV